MTCDCGAEHFQKRRTSHVHIFGRLLYLPWQFELWGPTSSPFALYPTRRPSTLDAILYGYVQFALVCQQPECRLSKTALGAAEGAELLSACKSFAARYMPPDVAFLSVEDVREREVDPPSAGVLAGTNDICSALGSSQVLVSFTSNFEQPLLPVGPHPYLTCTTCTVVQTRTMRACTDMWSDARRILDGRSRRSRKKSSKR